MDKTSLLTLLYMHACWREQTDINISLQRQSLVHRSFLRTDDLCLTCSLLAKMFRSLNLPLKASLIPCSNAKRSGTNWCPDLAALSNFEHWTKGRIRVTIGKHTYDGHLSRTIHLGIHRPLNGRMAPISILWECLQCFDIIHHPFRYVCASYILLTVGLSQRPMVRKIYDMLFAYSELNLSRFGPGLEPGSADSSSRRCDDLYLFILQSNRIPWQHNTAGRISVVCHSDAKLSFHDQQTNNDCHIRTGSLK